MASEAAKAVAQEVIKVVSKGEIPNKEKIQIEKGYSKNSARSYKAMNTKTFKREIAPFLTRLLQHRERVIEKMEETIDSAEYRDLSSSLERTTKVIQLVTGGSTENVAIGVKKLTDDELQHLADGGKTGTSET